MLTIGRCLAIAEQRQSGVPFVDFVSFINSTGNRGPPCGGLFAARAQHVPVIFDIVDVSVLLEEKALLGAALHLKVGERGVDNLLPPGNRP